MQYILNILLLDLYRSNTYKKLTDKIIVDFARLTQMMYRSPVFIHVFTATIVDEEGGKFTKRNIISMTQRMIGRSTAESLYNVFPKSGLEVFRAGVSLLQLVVESRNESFKGMSHEEEFRVRVEEVLNVLFGEVTQPVVHGQLVSYMSGNRGRI